MTFFARRSLSAALFASALLAGCGGDSSAPAPAPAPAPPPPPPVTIGPTPTCTVAGDTFSVVADASVPVGRTAGAVVAGCSGALQNVAWQQTGGPAVTLQSARSQAISFDTTAAGTYSFSVSFVDSTGAQRTATASISVTAATTPVNVVARADQAVRMGGKVSVRAWPAAASGETLDLDPDRRAEDHARYERSEPHHLHRADRGAGHRTRVSRDAYGRRGQ